MAVNKKGKPACSGQRLRQAGAVATAIKIDNVLRWEVRRQRDGLIRETECLAQTSHWTKA